jgi:RND family efflux transporter MFP subunit
MTKNKKRLYIIGSVVLVIVLVPVYMRIKDLSNPSSNQRVLAPSVKVSAPVREKLFRKLSFTGDILPIQQASIYSRVSGNIEKIYVDIGDYVQKGKVLANIDQTIYVQNTRQTESVYKQSLATLANNKITYERNQQLYERGLLAKSDLDNSKTAVDVAQAQTDAAQANYKNAQTQLTYCRITAPFSGYVIKRLLDPGTYITANAPTSNSTIFVLAEIDKLKVLVNILEKDLPQLANIKEAQVTTDAYPEEIFPANVRAMSESFDLSTRTMPTEVDIQNRNQLLKPGMFAKIDLILEEKDSALVLPVETLLQDDQGKYVYTLNKDTVVNKRYVQIGIEENNKDEIVSGISDQDKIVTVGQQLIKDGMKVRITK